MDLASLIQSQKRSILFNFSLVTQCIPFLCIYFRNVFSNVAVILTKSSRGSLCLLVFKPLKHNSATVWGQVLLVPLVAAQRAGPESPVTAECLHCWMCRTDRGQQQYSAVHGPSRLTWHWLFLVISSQFVCVCVLVHQYVSACVPACLSLHTTAANQLDKHTMDGYSQLQILSLSGQAGPSTPRSIKLCLSEANLLIWEQTA